MPSSVRLGDTCTGHPPCFSSRPNISASSNVFVNSRGGHRLGDSWARHCCSGRCHTGVLVSGSPTVFINSKPAGRVGDSVNCGSKCATGSSNVFING